MALYFGGEALLFTSLGFEREAIRPVDLAHAAVYATATSVAYELLGG
jgi:hypothetical protein